ncbi:hypothetical protein BH10CYA1_BH10CYA1_06850 [soil metagenome]
MSDATNIIDFTSFPKQIPKIDLGPVKRIDMTATQGRNGYQVRVFAITHIALL